MQDVKIFLINEMTIWRFLLSCAGKQAPYVLAVDPLFPPLQAMLSRIIKGLTATGRARWITEILPLEGKLLWDYPHRAILHDVFGRTESWHGRHFRFDHVDKAVPDYAYAFRKIVSNYMKHRHFEMLLILDAIKENGDGNVRFFGLQDHTSGLMESYTDEVPESLNPDTGSIRFLINPIVLAVAITLGILWTLSRLRWRPPKPKNYFFAADFNEGPKEFPLYAEMRNGGEVLLVRRNRSYRLSPHPELTGFDSCLPTEGTLGPGAVLASAAMILRDAIAIGRATFRCTPPVFYQAALLPFRRAVLRAFFSRFRPRYFWGADDINVEHILRRQELHRIGGISLGLCHGYPVAARIHTPVRDVSFDVYFMTGLALYQKYLRHVWPADMVVKAAGSFDVRVKQFRNRLSEQQRDILITASLALGYPAAVTFVRDVAAAFPERKILLQAKKMWDGTEARQAFVDDCTSGMSNVHPVSGPPHEIFKDIRYVLSDPSTIVLEALEFGRTAFMYDVLDFHRECIFRDFKGLCVKSGAEAARRIISIEKGTETYRPEEYASLTNLTDRTFLDVIRAEVGLPDTSGEFNA